MVITSLLVATWAGSAMYLECQTTPRGTPLPPDAPYTLAVTLSSRPDLYHVETRGPDFRTSTMGVGDNADAWWWDDWRDNVLGTSRIRRDTLAYRSDRPGLHLVGQCRKRTTPLWFDP